jgi:DNA replication protein DnaC
MSLQHQRIAELCEQLKLAGLGAQWPALAQDAARNEASFADFLEKLLASELVLRDERRTSTLMKLATMPAVKTLEQFDWGCAGGAPKAQIQELAHLAFVQRAENVVLLGPSGWARPTSPWHWASARWSPGTRSGSSARPT